MELKNNLDLWKSVEKTDPKHTKKANVRGNKITAIAPQYQIMNATEQFGSYGKTWGFKKIELDYNLIETYNVVVFKGLFFYPGGEFEIISSIRMYMNKENTMVDGDFAKKIETDTLTKALSKLGFNADVFMGRYDDVKYLDEVTQEFAPKKEVVKTEPKKEKAIIKTDEQIKKGAEWCIQYNKTTVDLAEHCEFTEDIEKLINNEIQKSM